MPTPTGFTSIFTADEIDFALSLLISNPSWKGEGNGINSTTGAYMPNQTNRNCTNTASLYDVKGLVIDSNKTSGIKFMVFWYNSDASTYYGNTGWITSGTKYLFEKAPADAEAVRVLVDTSVMDVDSIYFTGIGVTKVATIYSGSSAPSISVGSNGDIYIQTS